MNSTWQTQEWRENREKFLTKHPFCAWHGEPVKSTTVHHPQKPGTISEKDYLSMEDCLALCKRCNYAIHKKLKLCPVCKEHYFKSKKGRDRCWKCFIETDFGKAVKDYYDARPEERRKKK